MADIPVLPTPVKPPSNVTDLASATRLAMAAMATALATDGANYLVAHQLITSTSTAEVISYGSALLLGIGSLVWAKLKNINTGNRLIAAGATGDPMADPKAPEVVAAVVKAISNPNSPIVAK